MKKSSRDRTLYRIWQSSYESTSDTLHLLIYLGVELAVLSVMVYLIRRSEGAFWTILILGIGGYILIKTAIVGITDHLQRVRASSGERMIAKAVLKINGELLEYDEWHWNSGDSLVKKREAYLFYRKSIKGMAITRDNCFIQGAGRMISGSALSGYHTVSKSQLSIRLTDMPKETSDDLRAWYNEGKK